MAIPVLNASTGNTTVGTAFSLSATLTHAANVFVLVWVGFVNVGGASHAGISSVTVGGVAASYIDGLNLGGNKVAGYWYGVYRAPGGSETVTITLSGMWSNWGFTAQAFTNISNTGPYYEALVRASGNTTAISPTVPAGTTDRLVVQGIICARGAAPSATVAEGVGQTQILEYIWNDGFNFWNTIESNYEANSADTLMDDTLSQTPDLYYVTCCLALIPESSSQVVILTGPRSHTPFLRTFQIHAWTKDFTIPTLSYVRLTLSKGAGQPGFYIRMSDNRNIAGDYLHASDIGKGILNTIHIAELADGQYDYQMFGLIETTKKTQGPFGQEYEISGNQFGSALADYYANGQAYGANRDWGDVIANPTDGLMTVITQIGLEGVQYPGVLTGAAGYNPGAATSVQTSLDYAAGMCGSTTKPYRAYFCSSIHGEAKRDTLHFEPLVHNLNPYMISMREAMDVAESAPQIPWEAQQLAELGETTRYQVGTAVVAYGADNFVRVRGSKPPVRYFQLAYTSTSGEADDFGDKMIALRGVNLMNFNVRLWGSMRYVPSNNILVEDEGRLTLMAIDRVTKHRWPQGSLDDIYLSAGMT